jgi:hypothetical protein
VVDRLFYFVMKKIIIGLFMLCSCALCAQPATFLPDTLNILNGSEAIGIDILPLSANKQHLILTRNASPFVGFVKIDSLGRQLNNIEFRPFGNSKYTFSAFGGMVQLKNKNWLLPTWVQTAGIYDNYHGLVVFNTTLTDTLQTSIGKFHYLGADRNSSYAWAAMSRDSASIWVLGNINITATIRSAAVSHINTNLYAISNYVLDKSSQLFYPLDIIATTDNKCIISAQTEINISADDQVAIAKIGDNGLAWYKEFGNTNLNDYDPLLFSGSTDSTYRLIYAKAFMSDPQLSDSKIHLYSIEFDNIGNVIDSSQIVPIGQYARLYSHTQTADGNILLGMFGEGSGYLPRIFKLSRAGQLLWTSMIPQPQVGQYTSWGVAVPDRILATPDGGFLCTGQYYNFYHTPESTVWVGKMDSTGCWENCMMATNPLNLPKGDFVKVFPNPTNGIIHLENLPENTAIQVCNSIGQLLQIQNNQSDINLSPYPNGIYFLHIKTNKMNTTQKVVLQR